MLWGISAPKRGTGGPLAYVRDGDIIEIDVSGNIVNLLISDEKLRDRMQSPPGHPDHPAPGFLSAYRRTVRGAKEGPDPVVVEPDEYPDALS